MRLGTLLLVLACSVCWGQSSAPGEPSPDNVVMSKLFPPVYSPLARQARISGDVKLQMSIRQDGSVASASVISGHPMLTPAALDSAQKSRFECRRCDDQLTSFSLNYSFRFLEGTGCIETTTTVRVRSPRCFWLRKCGEQRRSDWHYEYRAPEVTESPGHVTILASGGGCVEPQVSH